MWMNFEKRKNWQKIGQVLTCHHVIQLSQSYVLASKVNPFLHQMFPLILTITTPCASEAHNTRYTTNTFLDAQASLRSITLQMTTESTDLCFLNNNLTQFLPILPKCKYFRHIVNILWDLVRSHEISRDPWDPKVSLELPIDFLDPMRSLVIS